MRRVFVFMMLCVTAFPAGTLAGARLLGLHDHFDSFQSVRVAQMYPKVAEQAQALHHLLETFLPRTLAGVEQALGQPVASWPDSTYAMPLCQTRMVGFGGFGHPTIRPEFYLVDPIGGLQVWYFPDSTTVSTTVVYLRVDSLFTPLSSHLVWRACLASVFLAGFTRATSDSCQDISKMDERELLLVVRCIPIGSSAEDISKLVPKFQATEDHGTSLSAGAARLTFLGHEVVLKFNLKADSLYGMYYQTDLPSAPGDSLFDHLVAFYTQLYGPALVDDGADSPYFEKARSWCTSEYEVGVSCSLAGNRRLVGWGFQTSAVTCAWKMGAKK
jgi:hypothetical protein